MAPVTLAKRVIGGGARGPATAPPVRRQGGQSYEDVLRTLSEASVERCFNAFRDVPWDDPAYALVEDDERWILPSVDPLGAHPWYRSLSRERQIEIGRRRLALITKIGSQFEQLLLQGGSGFLLRTPNDNPEFRYFMHELTEETHHIQMFQEFTNRVCPEVTGGPRWLVNVIPLVAQFGWMSPTMFFTIILAGEEPIDHVQKDLMRRGGGHPLLRRIMQIHIAEEARHIGFAHAWLEHHVPNRSAIARVWLGIMWPMSLRLGADVILVPSRADRALMGIPDDVAAEVWGNGPEAAKFRRDLFSDVRMLADEIGLRTPLTRWAWRLWGVDGRPARFRAEPSSAAA
ncbi:diiron oxygenase [Nocardioides sp. BP30]|uniref:AurF N-oxygenase family protein n=1 Tax=Nocardioides sp. BP30 TaxID=3036374 RepID=UPI0024689AFE|nr:diiron oxygenase [Nocardioides sp. BP30]WGL52701.1 diiron oxygenase [Nocardioides sp. BP30]